MPIRYLVFYFEIILIFVFLFLTYKFLYDIKLNELLIFIFFSPIFLIYPVAENEVLARKEYLFFSLYLVYLNLLISNSKKIFWYDNVNQDERIDLYGKFQEVFNEIKTNEYRVKKGLVGINFAKRNSKKK